MLNERDKFFRTYLTDAVVMEMQMRQQQNNAIYKSADIFREKFWEKLNATLLGKKDEMIEELSLWLQLPKIISSVWWIDKLGEDGMLDKMMAMMEKRNDWAHDLIRYKNTTEWLWAINQDPKKVTYKWIRKHAFRLDAKIDK